MAAPDRIIDLHGHTLASAHLLLEEALGRAVAAGDRLVVIVAGKDRPGPGRGAIRREVGHWLAASRFASRIAAIRAAHPRHGGAGAFYVVLRRS
ncbi:Smr/MutS family protein [Sphingomonas jatrophae]